MLKKSYLVFILFCFTLSSISQKELSIESAVLGTTKEFKVKNLKNLSWVTNTVFSYIKDKSIILYDIKKEKQEVLISLEQFNSILENDSIEKLKKIPYFKWINDSIIKFRVANNFFVCNIRSRQVVNKIILPKDSKNSDYSPNNNFIAYTKENNIFIDSANVEIPLTLSEDENIISGQFASRNEFGIVKGTFWSPDSKLLAYYIKDVTSVSTYPILDYTKSPVEVKNIKYPRTGEKSEIVKLAIYNIATKTTVYIEEGGEIDYRYLTNITWAPDSKSIYVQVLSRNQKELKLNSYSSKTGNLIKNLLTETNSKWVEPENKIVFLNNDQDQFIYQSEEDGFNHLYLYSTDGELLKQLTTGSWVVTKFLGISQDDKFAYYMSTKESPLDRHLHKVNIETLEDSKITKAPGVHSVTLSPDFYFFINKYSNVSTPRIITISKTENGAHLIQLLVSNNPFRGYKLSSMNIFKIKSKDKSTNLYCRIIVPKDFDNKKKYPAIVYVYGGPHVQLIRNQWLGGARLWQYYMAQKGYVVFTMDNRGSANRGFDFESIIHNQCGKIEMEDQIYGVDYLKSLKYIDPDRIGVFGWSYGGFMTTSLLLNYPNTFKVGVAGGPVTDWKFYETMYGERYMETPQSNPEGYEMTSTLNKVDSLKARFLMIHGELDPVVVKENSMKLLRSFIKAKKQVDYMIYPAHEHNVRGEDRVNLMNKISIYFDDFLKK